MHKSGRPDSGGYSSWPLSQVLRKAKIWVSNGILLGSQRLREAFRWVRIFGPSLCFVGIGWVRIAQLAVFGRVDGVKTIRETRGASDFERGARESGVTDIAGWRRDC
jgi:hypothetical protein